jgi:hypothetical protein
LHAEGIGDTACQRKVMFGAGMEFVLANRRQNIDSFVLFGIYKNIIIKSS